MNKAEQIFNSVINTTMQIFKLTPQFMSKDKLTLDIGSNIGCTAQYFTKFSKEVHCFEPLPAHNEEFRTFNIPNCIIHEYALSDVEGEFDFHVYHYASSLIYSDKWNYYDKIKVKTRTLDSFNFQDVAFIKIDVEGSELNVLKGAVETIKRNRPVLILEIIQDQLTHPAKDIFDFLNTLGYKGYYAQNNELIPVINIEEVTNTRQKELNSYDTLFKYETN